MTTTEYPHRAIKLTLGGGAAAVLLIYLCWPPGIPMDIMLAIMSVVELLGGDRVLPMRPHWVGAASRMAAAAVFAIVVWRTIRYRRVTGGACGRCGRDGTPPRDRRRLALWAAGLSAVPAAGYAALKLHWAFGGTVGLTDPSVFADVKPWSPGFTDTAAMAAIGIGIALAMALRWPRFPRWMLLTPAVIGLAMLLPVAVLGTAGNILGVFDAVDGGLAPWVGWFVYSCFALWGAGLAIVTVEYHYGTRRACRVCGRG